MTCPDDLENATSTPGSLGSSALAATGHTQIRGISDTPTASTSERAPPGSVLASRNLRWRLSKPDHTKSHHSEKTGEPDNGRVRRAGENGDWVLYRHREKLTLLLTLAVGTNCW